MRDVTKAMLSYTWAVSLFGAQQAANMLRGRGSRDGSAAEAFDGITGAVNDQFDDAFQAAFRTGDRLQRGFVDLMLSGPSMLSGDMGRSVGDQFRNATTAADGRTSCCGGRESRQDGMPRGAAFGRGPGE